MAILVLGGGAAVAAAECGWVLWLHGGWELTESKGFGGTYWLVDSGHETIKACTTARNNMFRNRLDAAKSNPNITDVWENPDRASFGYITQDRDMVQGDLGAKHEVRQYVCLPDTIDPREKK